MRSPLLHLISGLGAVWLSLGAALAAEGPASTDANAPPTTITVAQADDAYRPPSGSYGGQQWQNDGQAQRSETYVPPRNGGGGRGDDAYRPPATSNGGYGGTYDSRNDYDGRSGQTYGGGGDRGVAPSGSYGEPYAPPRGDERGYRDDRTYRDAGNRDYYDDRGPRRDGPIDRRDEGTYSKDEIVSAGHAFFGSITQGLASVIEHAFKKAGRPNGYILGEDAGGAFVAGLRYGEGKLYTKNAGTHPVYWQGPSIGYDFGGAGAKTMVLVYNLHDISDVYNRYGGVEGSAYLVGGVGIQFQKYRDVTMAPIRAGVGLRLGANVGYLKYTRSPTWNPF